MMDVLLLRFKVNVIIISQEYQRFLPPVSEQELCERVRQRVPAPRSTTDVWRGIAYAYC